MQDPDVAETRDRAAVDVCRLPRDHGGTLAGGSALVMLSLHTLRCKMRGVPLGQWRRARLHWPTWGGCGGGMTGATRAWALQGVVPAAGGHAPAVRAGAARVRARARRHHGMRGAHLGT